jgi:hydrogenase nickel incorporation protein HypA/HybF
LRIAVCGFNRKYSFFLSIRNPQSAIRNRKAMHELSIAMSMVEMASEEAARRGGVRINAIHLKLGPLSGVVKDALLFSYDVACEGTPLAGSRLVIEEAEVVVYCQACRTERRLASIQKFFCPICSAPTPQVMQGKELEVVALEIES